MKLFRLETEYLGDRCGVFCSKANDEALTLCDETLWRELYDLAEKLHCPRGEDLIEGEPPKNALFYFTKKGKVKHYDLIQKLREVYGSVDMTVFNIELDTDDLIQYKVWYQDESQVCLEIIRKREE